MPKPYTPPALISPPAAVPAAPPSVVPVEDIHARYKEEAELAVRSAAEQMSSYNTLLEARTRERDADAALAQLQVQCDARLSSLQLQQTAETDRLRRLHEDSTREHDLTTRHMQQQHEAKLSLLGAKHNQELTSQAAKFEEHLQMSLTRQHDEFSSTINNMTTKHREALQELEKQWADKATVTNAQHTEQLGKLRRDAEMQLKQIEGSFTLEQQQQRERDMKERTEQAKLVAEKVNMVEARNLELQMQVVDLTSKHETGVARLHAAEAQHEQVKERLEHNLKGLMSNIEEERQQRKEIEVALQHNAQEANRRLQDVMQQHQSEAQEQATASQQQISRLQDELHKVVEASKEREIEMQSQSRQMDKEMAQFQEKLNQEVRGQLQALCMKHSQELQNMQIQMQIDATQQNSDNVKAIDKAYNEKIKNLEFDSQKQLTAVEVELGSRLKESQLEVQRLMQDLNSQRELSALEEQTQKKMHADRIDHMRQEYERELESKVHELKAEYNMSISRQEREFAVRLEQEKLSVAQQCRGIAAEVQERDRDMLLKLEDEIKLHAIEKIELEERRLRDVQAAERVQDQIKADAQEAILEMSKKHIAQLKAAEGENARLREEVEVRLAAAAERYNEQLSGLDDEKRTIHDVVQVRIDEIRKHHTEEVERLAANFKVQLDRANEDLEYSRATSTQLAEQNKAQGAEILNMKMLLENKELDIRKLFDEKEALVRGRETACNALSDKMQQQLATLENERYQFSQRVEAERQEHSRQKINEAHDAVREVARLQAIVDSQTKHIATLQSLGTQRLPQEELFPLKDKLAAAEEENSRLRKQLEDAQVQMAQVKATAAGQVSANRDFAEELQVHDRDLMAATLEMADTQAVQKIYEAEQKHAQEKNEMHETFQRQLEEAERVAQQQLGKVGDKFTQQMAQLQDLVTSLQQRLMAKDSQAKRIDQDLKRAQRAISEIASIYQAREQHLINELQMSQGLKQQNVELQLQHAHDNQQLIALQAQVQQAMASMHSAVHDGAPQSEVFLSPASQVLPVQVPSHSPLPTSPVQFASSPLVGTPQKSRELQLFESTPTKPFHSPLLSTPARSNSKAQILAQHEFSQQLANQQAVILKQQQQQTLSFLRSPQQAGIMPQTALSASQVDAL